MKNLFFAFSLLLVNYLGAADLNSEIKSVTVFPYSAQISRTANTIIKSGVNEITLTNLSPFINSNSIRVGASEGKILSVKFNYNYLKQNQNTKRVKEVEDSLAIIKVQIQTEKNALDAYKMELDFIAANKSIKGNAVLDIADMEDFLFYYRKTIPQIQNKILLGNLKLDELQKKELQLKNTLGTLKSVTANRIGEIVIELASNANSRTIIDFDYTVSQAGWAPFYNIRANSLNEPVSLEYMASIWQNTNENWDQVNLTLATGNPDFNSTIPELRNWELRNVDYNRKSYKKAESAGYLADDMVLEEVAIMSNQKMKSNFKSEPSTQQETLTFTSFKINTPYTLNSGAGEMKIEVSKHKMNANFNYYAVPKLTEKVFLQAEVTGWENLGLLPGNSKIYFENTYVGESFINTRVANDTLKLSLGYDPNIILERTKLNEKTKKTFLGNKKVVTYAYEIKVKNAKSKDVQIIIEDQFPLTTNNQIKVEQLNYDGGLVDEKTGKITWTLTIPKGTTSTLLFSYEVTYPKDLTLNFE